MSPTTSTLDRLVLSTESSTSVRTTISSASARFVRPKGNKAIQSAIYGYIRAMRALGRKQLNTIEIAEALSIPLADVNRAVPSLKKKGIKGLNV